MFDSKVTNKEFQLHLKELRPGVKIGHFTSVNSTMGFGPGQIYVKILSPSKQNESAQTIFLLHDLCQYHGRFQQLIEWLNIHCPTLRIVVMDFVGHGLSSGTRGQFDKFDVLVQDFHNLLNFIPKEKNDRWIVLGHGMGGMVALDLINRYQESAGNRINGLILSNFILKFQSPLLGMDEKVVKPSSVIRKIISQIRPTRLYSGSDLLTDPLAILDYEQDPLVVHRPTLNCIKELQKKMHYIYQDSYFIDKPVLLLKSEFGRAIFSEGIEYFSKGIKKELLTEKKYSLLKHDLYNEKEKESVFRDIQNWINHDEA